MDDTAENYLFLGRPKSGKSTYLSLMAQHLQDVANRTKSIKFRYYSIEESENEDTEKDTGNTEDFMAECINRIHNQQWPDKTLDYYGAYSFELEKYFTILGKPVFKDFFYQKSIIDYHDYPGEAFDVAFGGVSSPPPHIKAAAQDMKERIASASGLFLILDMEALFNEENAKEQRATLTGLFQYIRKVNPEIKLAIIFNKLEVFCGNEPDPVTLMRRKYSNAYANLPHKHNFFKVYPLGTVTTGNDGAIYPPQKLAPRNILDPVRWMIDL